MKLLIKSVVLSGALLGSTLGLSRAPVSAASYYVPCPNSNLVVMKPNQPSGSTVWARTRCQSGTGVSAGEVFAGYARPITAVCLVRVVLHYPTSTVACSYSLPYVGGNVGLSGMATQVRTYPGGYLLSGNS